jgi:hypothetical protein
MSTTRIHQVIIRGVVLIDHAMWEKLEKPLFELVITANDAYHALTIQKFVRGDCSFATPLPKSIYHLNFFADLRNVVLALKALHPVKDKTFHLMTDLVMKDLEAQVVTS